MKINHTSSPDIPLPLNVGEPIRTRRSLRLSDVHSAKGPFETPRPKGKVDRKGKGKATVIESPAGYDEDHKDDGLETPPRKSRSMTRDPDSVNRRRSARLSLRSESSSSDDCWNFESVRQLDCPHFPIIKLQEGAATKARNRFSFDPLHEIRDFFSGPVPGLFSGPGDTGWEMGGMSMEFALRRSIGAELGGDLGDITGWKGEENNYKDWLNIAQKRLAEGYLDGEDEEQKPRKKVKVERASKPKKVNKVNRVTKPARKPATKAAKPLRPANQRKHFQILGRDKKGKGKAQSAKLTAAKLTKLRRTQSNKIVKKSASSKAKSAPVQRSKRAVKQPPARVVVKEEPVKKMWGKLAKEAQETWPGENMKEFYSKKRYLLAGLYSSAYKKDRPPVDRLRTYTAEGFKFPMPINYGVKLFEEQDFELPYDIVKWMEQLGGPNNIRDRAVRKAPSPFIKIQKNIIVDRKPRKPKEIPICQCELPADGGMGCRENCLNRCMFIECSPKHCPLGEMCSNQSFQRRENVSQIEVFWTSQRGFGLRTKVAIPRNQMVIEYRGEIISQKTCIERMQTVYKGLENYYFLNYANGEVIDACRKGTEARFVNHCCEPNCHIEKWYVGGEFSVGVFASEDIPKGAELTYDYRFDAFGPMQECLCGAANCRGRIGVNKRVEAKEDGKDSRGKKQKSGGRSNKKAAKSKKKASSDDREFWVRKQEREKLASNFRDVMKHRAFYRDSGIFLVRNLKTCMKGELTRGKRAGASTSSRAKNRGAGANGDESGQKRRMAIAKRRKRNLEEILDDLRADAEKGKDGSEVGDDGTDPSILEGSVDSGEGHGSEIWVFDGEKQSGQPGDVEMLDSSDVEAEGNNVGDGENDEWEDIHPEDDGKEEDIPLERSWKGKGAASHSTRGSASRRRAEALEEDIVVCDSEGEPEPETDTASNPTPTLTPEPEPTTPTPIRRSKRQSVIASTISSQSLWGLVSSKKGKAPAKRSALEQEAHTDEEYGGDKAEGTSHTGDGRSSQQSTPGKALPVKSTRKSKRARNDEWVDVGEGSQDSVMEGFQEKENVRRSPRNIKSKGRWTFVRGRIRKASSTSSERVSNDTYAYDSDVALAGGGATDNRSSFETSDSSHYGIDIAPSPVKSSPTKRSPTKLKGVLAGVKGMMSPTKTTSGAPTKSYALENIGTVRTNLGNTKVVMALLSEAWIFHMGFILAGTYLMTFHLPQFYIDDELWNYGCFWKLGWLLPLPYTFVCFYGLSLPFRTPKFLNRNAYRLARDPDLKVRRCDNLYILTVTKGDNKDAVMRAWNAHRHLESLDRCIRVHVLTDEPNHFEGINCYTCPKDFKTSQSKYKARALEWYRQTVRYTEYDWVLHLDEESVIDDETVKRCLDFIRYETAYHFGQGVILYNQYRYWANWIFTVADAIRVGDDLSRFQMQYSYFHRPIFGAHGSFLLCNGLVENGVTWDLGSLTEDYQFATHAWEMGFRCGKVAGLVREQSPMDFMGFMKQRRRWYVGIRRLPGILPKLWNFFWTLGILCLYCTIASVVLGFYVPLGTPRWFGLLKDFSFVTFVYLYILGTFVQNIDRKMNPILVILAIPVTFIIQFIAVIMEALAVMYALIFPPKDFDVIKK
ncbi:hypothetical protein HK104_001114 [Borealophlyctis nickersoniae]|nr:hypothetical protein HK104_001114 [Borealophlyctis nickersoniae]